MSKLLRLWRQRAIFEETSHVLDPIDAFIARVEKGQSSLAGPAHARAPSPASPSVGDKRRLPPPQDPRGRRGAGPPPPPPPAPPTASQAAHHQQQHHHRGGGGGGGAGSPRGGGGSGASEPSGGPPRTLEFIVAVDREMKTLLERLCEEVSGGSGPRPMGIEELARRNPAAAEGLKRAAEAAVVERMVREAEQAVAVRFFFCFFFVVFGFRWCLGVGSEGTGVWLS